MIEKYLKGRSRSTIKLGLERIKSCLNFLGNPQKNFKSVLIGGTNGKGSVTYYLSNLACRFTPYKIGRYTSPHLISWSERFVINEKVVSFALLEEVTREIVEKIKQFESRGEVTSPLTEFEIYTIIAFCLFAKEKVDIAFLEVGMGGRLDATNVLSGGDVLCSIITNVSFDHMEHLGETIEKIAFEKAGIIKENNYVITSCEGDASGVVENIAKKLNCNLISVNVKNCFFYQDKNIKLAVKAWEIVNKDKSFCLSKDAESFLRSLKFPGRFHYLKEKNILLDSAHNPAGAFELRKLLDEKFKNKKIIYIIGILDKDYDAFIKNLIPQNSYVICTEPKSQRATKKEFLSKSVLSNGSLTAISVDLKSAIIQARKINHDVVVITGSTYLVGEALDLLRTNKIKEIVLK